MLGLTTFQTQLHTKVALKPSLPKQLSELIDNARAWSATLSMKTEEEQCAELESVLAAMRLAPMPDAKRIELMDDIYLSVERVIGQLHQHYIYEASVITDSQYAYANQVKSLYFLSALIYQDIVDRQLLHSKAQMASSGLKFKLIKAPTYNKEILVALYRASTIYLQLLMEQSLTYQRVPALYWQQLNRLYKTALTREWHNIDLQRSLSINSKVTITDIYRQACLHSLLGLASYRRQDIIGVHKLLPFWAQQVQMTQKAVLELRLFVDLNESNPPMQLSPHSKVNPYEPDRLCVFLDLSAFENYLKTITQQVVATPKMSTQIRLAKIAWHTLHIKTGRREERHISYDNAIVVSGFGLIHYYMAGKQSLTKLIHHHKLPQAHLPQYDTTPKVGYINRSFKVQIMDTSTTGCRFKWNLAQQSGTDANVVDEAGGAADKARSTNLQVLSLFAMQIQAPESQPRGGNRIDIHSGWQIGLIRWIETQDGVLEAGGRIIGYSATACGLRLENKDSRSQVFVPALLLAGNDTLNTKTTLLVPRHNFRIDDKVVLRIGSDQTLLRLQSVYLSSDDFEQYEILRMT